MNGGTVQNGSGTARRNLDKSVADVQRVFGKDAGSAGAVLAEAIRAPLAVVDEQLAGLTSDARAAQTLAGEAKDAARSAEKAATEAKQAVATANERDLTEAQRLVTEAKGASEAAQRVVGELQSQLQTFTEGQATVVAELRDGARGAAESSRVAEEASTNAANAAAELKSMVDSISITLPGEKEPKTYTGDEAIGHIGSMLSEVATLSIGNGATGVTALNQLLSTISDLQLTVGKEPVKGLSALTELVSGLNTVTVVRSTTTTEDGTPKTINESLTGFNALAYLCGRVEALHEQSYQDSSVDTALKNLFRAQVIVGTNSLTGTPVIETKTGVELLIHIFNTMETLQSRLRDEVESVVNAVFTLEVPEVGADGQEKPTTLSGRGLADYLVQRVEGARTSAGSAVQQAQRAEEAVRGAYSTAEAAAAKADETAQKADTLEATVRDAFSALDGKVRLLFDVLTGKVDISALLTPEAQQAMETPSYPEAQQVPPTGEVSG